jgi:hypothetical protein
MELLLGAMVMAAWTMVAPRALADVVATWRASKAGAWDVVDADRTRREARRDRRAGWAERIAAAWGERRRRRAEQAGTTDGTFRPGFRAYAADVYSGWWEDRLDHRRQRREVRPPFDPTAPTWRERLDERIRAQVQRYRQRRGDTRSVEPFAGTAEPDPTAPEPSPEWLDCIEGRCDCHRTVDEPVAPTTVTPDYARRGRQMAGQERLSPDVPSVKELWVADRKRWLAERERAHREVDVVPDPAPDAPVATSDTKPGPGSEPRPVSAPNPGPESTLEPIAMNGEPPMSAPTGEAVNYETTVAELEAIAEEQRKQIDQAQACLDAVTAAKSAIDGMQESYRATSSAAGSVNDHLTALNLDGETLGHVGNSTDAMPPSAVDNMYDQLEEIEAAAKTQRDNAEVALASTEAALKTVHEKYGDAHTTVQGELGGDSRFLDSGGAAVSQQPVGAGV